MKNLLRTAQREIKSLKKKQAKLIGHHSVDVYLDFNRPNQEYKPLYFLVTISNLPDYLFKRLQESKYYQK